jgi:hypothetical protein
MYYLPHSAFMDCVAEDERYLASRIQEMRIIQVLYYSQLCFQLYKLNDINEIKYHYQNKPILASLFSDSCANEGVRAMFYLLKSESVMPVHAVLSRRVHSMFSEGRFPNILFVIVELNKLIQQCLIRRRDDICC